MKEENRPVDKKPDLDVHDLLDRIRSSTNRLRQLSFISLLLSAWNLLILVMYLSAARLDVEPFMAFEPRIYLLSAVGVCVLGIISAARFEIERRHADAWFEEVSDELHWRTRRDEDEKYASAGDRPMLAVRVTLRQYARASELPFVPGKSGPILLIVFNVLVVIATVLIRQSH